MIIFIDFDDVLFNTKRFKSDLQNLFFQNGISREIFEKYYSSNVSSGATYDPWEHVELIGEKEGVDIAKAQRELGEFMMDTNPYLFDDSVDFLRKFDNDSVFILSYGDPKFQKMKIGECRVGKYCNDVIITNKLKSDVMEKFLKEEKQNIFFIDDRVEQVDDIKKRFPFVKTILMQRAEGRYSDEPTDLCDFKVRNLRQAADIIKEQKNYEQ